MVMIAIGMQILTTQKQSEQILITRNQSEQNERRIISANQKLDTFVDAWFDRVNKSNVINNSTQDKLLNISETLKQRQSEHIQQSEYLVSYLQNRTQLFNNITHSIVNLTQVNEDERKNAVDRLHKDHVLIMKGLNISSNDNKTDAEEEAQKTIKLLEKLLNETGSGSISSLKGARK